MRFPSSEVISYGGKTGRIGNSRAGTVNGYNWGGIILMLFHVLASPDRVVRVGRSISDRRVFREGQGARFGRESGRRPAGKRYSLLCSSFSVSSRSV